MANPDERDKTTIQPHQHGSVTAAGHGLLYRMQEAVSVVFHPGAAPSVTCTAQLRKGTTIDVVTTDNGLMSTLSRAGHQIQRYDVAWYALGARNGRADFIERRGNTERPLSTFSQYGVSGFDPAVYARAAKALGITCTQLDGADITPPMFTPAEIRDLAIKAVGPKK